MSEAAAASINPLLPAMRSLQCWQNAQTKRSQELEADLYTRGCLQPLRVLFESHAIHVGAAVAIIIIPVVCFFYDCNNYYKVFQRSAIKSDEYFFFVFK